MVNDAVVNSNLDVLKDMQPGDIADFADDFYPSIKREDDGFYMVNRDGSYKFLYRHKSLMNLGSYFCAVPLVVREHAIIDLHTDAL